MDIKLHRIHVEVGHFIGEKRGKLVPLADIRKAFPDEHRVNEAVWILIENRIVVEDSERRGNYQLTRDGAVVVDEQWAKLQASLAAGKRVPMEETGDNADAAREKAAQKKAEDSAAGAAAKPATPKVRVNPAG